MPPPLSAGVLLYRWRDGALEVLLVHPGGPFWTNKDAGAWMIPKGGIGAGESAGDAALRELEEETGLALGYAPAFLCRIRQAGGKIVDVFAAEGEFATDTLVSMHFEMEWPSGSGELRRFPEVDAARWMPLDEARRMMLPSQLPVLDALQENLTSG